MRNRLRTRAMLLGAGVALLGAAPSARAQAQELTLERIYASRDFAVRGVAPRWMADGERFTVVEVDPETRATDVWVEGIRTGKRTRLVEGTTLVVEGKDQPILVEDYTWSPDEKKLLIYTNSQRVWRQNTKGEYYVYDLATKKLTPVSTAPGWQMFAKFSPDGSKVGFVRDGNIFVKELETGRERQLTTDGDSVVVNGITDWVYEEELGLADAWRWSPDGERIAYWRFDQSPIHTFVMLDELEGQYPRPIVFGYPKAGTTNSDVKVGVVELESGRTRWFDVGSDPEAYFARMDFAASPDEVVIQRLNRHQNRLDVLIGDVRTGKTRVLFTDTDRAWVDVDDDLTWLAGGEQLLWSSERDGWNHLYLHARDGRLIRQLTRGPWEVTGLYGVDEEEGWVYFSAARESPMQRHVYRVPLKGGEIERITDEPGTHGADFSPGMRLFVGVHSDAATPPVFTLREADGEEIKVLESNERTAANVRQLRVREPEFFRFRNEAGVELNGWMIKPADFDASRKYPVLMYVYGGPGSQTVTDAWGGSRYLWHQLLAQKGYIVVSIDNRGTGARGRDFKKATYLRLGELEVADQIAGARHLGSLPYVDAGRIGIWGWSYGGYMTALSLLKGGDLFRAGVAVAPVTDWKLYDTIYTERFMRTPQENEAGYRESAPTTHAAGLESRFLLIHGTGDDNVHFQNTTQLVSALQQAGKQFDLMMYPNKTHSISGGTTQLHLFTMVTKWLEENL